MSNQLKLNTMGWVKQESMTDVELLEKLKNDFPNSAIINQCKNTAKCGSVYEYLTDYIRDYYNVTLDQCSRVSKQLADCYGIKKFYYGD